MTGELISTGITFGVGRKSINSSFSGTAEFNNILLDSNGNFSGGTGGGTILSGGTDLYNIFEKKDGFYDLGTFSGGVINWDYLISKNAEVTLSGSGELYIVNVVSGNKGTLKITQDNIGSRNLILGGGGSDNKVSNNGGGALSLSTSGNSIDFATFVYDGNTFFWNVFNNYT